MNDSLVARVAALKTSPTPDLKQMWREMFLTEPPPFNRRFLETRLAYRIQELALGGLRRETIKRLEKLGEQLDGGKPDVRRRRRSRSGAQSKKPRVVRGLRLPQGLLSRFEVFVLAGKKGF